MNKTPITIFSGYLGSGKTTIILNSLKQFREPVNFALIKNEYGDASVDGTLLKQSNLKVKELINGCLCCILVGSLNDAINELIETTHPERILIEASGNALPFPILLELKKNDRVFVDGVISVVDCVNFERVKDTSVVAREQAKHTDLIIFNKVNLVDSEKLYRVKEDIFGINPDTPKIETNDGIVHPNILFGIEHKMLLDMEDEDIHDHDHNHQDHSMETFTISSEATYDLTKVMEVLKACNPNTFFRIKGIIKTEQGSRLINSVFGKCSDSESDPVTLSRIIFIGHKLEPYKSMVEDYLNHAVVSTI